MLTSRGLKLRTAAAVCLTLLTLVPVGLAASVRSVTTPGPVGVIALDGRQVAYGEGRSAQDCDRVRLWDLQTRRVTTFARTTHCVQTSTGSGISRQELSGNSGTAYTATSGSNQMVSQT